MLNLCLLNPFLPGCLIFVFWLFFAEKTPAFKRSKKRFCCTRCTTPAAEKIIYKWAFWCTDYCIIVYMIKIDWIAKLLDKKERSAVKEAERARSGRKNRASKRRGSKIHVDFHSGGRYLVSLCGPCHIYCIKVRVFICSKSAFSLSSPPCNKCRGYVIIGPRRITGLADCDDCIKACGTFVSSSAHLQISSWSEM